ncbi:MAG: transcriptional regulator [Candidatus Bathyarchaeota archaeon]|nr:transcriptional regulator [Candidatus Bathyarchaeota archaeon]
MVGAMEYSSQDISKIKVYQSIKDERKLKILVAVSEKPLTSYGIKRKTGLSEHNKGTKIHNLAEDLIKNGLLEKKTIIRNGTTKPADPRIEYTITQLGKKVLRNIFSWASSSMVQPEIIQDSVLCDVLSLKLGGRTPLSPEAAPTSALLKRVDTEVFLDITGSCYFNQNMELLMLREVQEVVTPILGMPKNLKVSWNGEDITKNLNRCEPDSLFKFTSSQNGLVYYAGELTPKNVPELNKGTIYNLNMSFKAKLPICELRKNCDYAFCIPCIYAQTGKMKLKIDSVNGCILHPSYGISKLSRSVNSTECWNAEYLADNIKRENYSETVTIPNGGNLLEAIDKRYMPDLIRIRFQINKDQDLNDILRGTPIFQGDIVRPLRSGKSASYFCGRKSCPDIPP